jgi:hypothetical protein
MRSAEPATPTQVSSARRGHGVRERLAMVAVSAAYLLARFVPMRGTNIATVLDTFSYFDSSRFGLASKNFWAGPRAVLYPLLAKLTGRSHLDLFLLQSMFAAVAWLALAWLVYTRLHNRTLAATTAVVVLFASLSLDVVQWDGVLVTESLTISLAVGMLVLGVLLVEAPSVPRAAWFTAVALLWVLLRDSNGYVVACVAVAFGIAAIRSRAKRPTFAVVAVALVVVFVLGVVSSSVGVRWAEPLEDVITIRALAHPDRAQYMLSRGLPLTNEEVAKIAGHCVVNRPPVFPCVLVTDPRFYRWIDEDGRSTYSRWVLSHPATALADPVRNSGELFGSRVGVDTFTRYRFEPANLAEQIFFVRNQRVLLAEALIAFGLVLAALRRRPSPLGWAVLTGLATTYPHMFAIWTFDGLETQRHALAASLILRLGIVLAAALALDARRGSSEAATDLRAPSQ